MLAPVLGDFYGRCLEKGELQLKYDQAGLTINYYDFHFPLRIESYTQLMTYQIGRLERSLGREHPDFIKLLGILYLLKNTTTESTGRQYRDQVAFVKGLLWELYQSNPEVQNFIDTNLQIFNGEIASTAIATTHGAASTELPEATTPTFDLLDAMLSDQFFRLSFWKVGAEELNYRRFFTINELICVSVDHPSVFDITHSLIQELVDDGWINGVRIDHIDGLYNPRRYLERLRKHLGNTYITVEKNSRTGRNPPRRLARTGHERLRCAQLY